MIQQHSHHQTRFTLFQVFEMHQAVTRARAAQEDAERTEAKAS
jgi:hypothetical protein